MPWHLILFVAAFILFVLAALGAPWTASPPAPWARFNLVAAGLACLTAAFMVGGMGTGR
jgi:hypothetical protein